MKGKVKCTCGWSWNKSDSSAKDMYICHQCGRDNSNNMKNGGDVAKAQGRKVVPPKTKVNADESDWGDDFRSVNDNLGVQAAKMFDPTGITSYPDVYYAAKDLSEGKGSVGNLVMNIVGALPMVGKAKAIFRLGKAANASKTVKNTVKVAKATEKLAAKANKATSLVPLATSANKAKKVVGKTAVQAERLAKWMSKPITPKSVRTSSKVFGKTDAKNLAVDILDLANVSADAASVAKQVPGAAKQTVENTKKVVEVTKEGAKKATGVAKDLLNEADKSIQKAVDEKVIQIYNELNPIDKTKTIQYYNTDPNRGEVEKPGQLADVQYVPISNSLQLKKWKEQEGNLKNGGWLDKYADGGTMQEHQENYNNSQASAPEGMVGDGFSNVGRNYSPAWGGQFKEGGEIPNAQKGKKVKYVESKNDPRYKAYRDSLSSYERGRKAVDLLNKNTIGKNWLDSYDVETNKKNLDKIYTEKEKKKLYNKKNYKNLEYFKKDDTNKDYWKPLQPGFDAINENVKISNVLPYAAFDIVGEENLNKVPVWKKPEEEVIVQRPQEIPITNFIQPASSSFNIEASLPVIRPDARVPKYYDVEDYTQGSANYINNQTNYRTSDLSTLSEQSPNNKRKITPRYQIGGNVYPVNYVPQAQDGVNLNTPENWEKSIRNIEHQIGNPNEWSIDGYRQLQKQINEYKFWRENTPEGKAVHDSHNEPNEYVVPLPNHLKIYKPLNMLEEVTPNYQIGGSVYPVNYVPKAQFGLGLGLAGAIANNIGSWFSDDEPVEKPVKKPAAKSKIKVDFSKGPLGEIEKKIKEEKEKQKTPVIREQNITEKDATKVNKKIPTKIEEKKNWVPNKNVSELKIPEQVTRQIDYAKYWDNPEQNFAVVDKDSNVMYYVNPQGQIVDYENVITGATNKDEENAPSMKEYGKTANEYYDYLKNTNQKVTPAGVFTLRSNRNNSVGKPHSLWDRIIGELPFVDDVRLNTLDDPSLLHAIYNEMPWREEEKKEYYDHRVDAYGPTGNLFRMISQYGVPSSKGLHGTGNANRIGALYDADANRDLSNGCINVGGQTKCFDILGDKSKLYVLPETEGAFGFKNITPSKNQLYTKFGHYADSDKKNWVEEEDLKLSREDIKNAKATRNKVANIIKKNKIKATQEEIDFVAAVAQKETKGGESWLSSLESTLPGFSSYGLYEQKESFPYLKGKSPNDEVASTQAVIDFYRDTKKKHPEVEYSFYPDEALYSTYNSGRTDWRNSGIYYGPEFRKALQAVRGYENGGSFPGATGNMYARVGAPSKGPRRNQVDVTDASAQNGQEMQYYQEGLDWQPKTISREGSIIKDDMGYWNPENWDSPVEIGSNEITMQNVPFDVLGISDEGDVQHMKANSPKNYKYKGKKVTEFRMAKNGIRQEQKGLVNLDQLTNFTNYNKPQPGGWLNKYN